MNKREKINGGEVGGKQLSSNFAPMDYFSRPRRRGGNLNSKQGTPGALRWALQNPAEAKEAKGVLEKSLLMKLNARRLSDFLA